MSTTYLQRTVSASADASGNATARMSPDVGEFWAPSIVRVSTGITPQNNNNANSSYAALYHGSIGAANSTTFLDDTFLGSGDASSVIAGTIVMFGEAITVQWKNVSPGDICILIVYGRSGDNLVELQSILSPVPGAKFSGNSGNAMLWDYNDQVVAGPNPISVPFFVTPFNLLCELTYVQFNITTTVATARAFGLTATVFDGVTNVPLFSAFTNSTQSTISTLTYSFSQGQLPYGFNAQVGASIPSKMILPPGTSILVKPSLPPSVDATWSNLFLVYRQYKSLSKVSFT